MYFADADQIESAHQLKTSEMCCLFYRVCNGIVENIFTFQRYVSKNLGVNAMMSGM